MKPRSRGLLREWWPALVIAALALLSIQMLRSSYGRWQTVLEEAVSGVDNVTESRRRLLRSYLVDQHQAQDNPTFDRASALAEVSASASALNNWFNGRSTLGGFAAAPPDDSVVITLGRTYQRALMDFRDALAARPADPVQRRRTFSMADQAAGSLESAVLSDLRTALDLERRSYRLRVGGWGAFLLLTGLGLVFARRGQRSAEAGRAESESRLSRLRAVAPVGIVECDTAGLVIAANVMWSRMTGSPEGDWVGRAWWEALAPPDRARAASLWEGSVRSGREQSGEFRLSSEEKAETPWVLARTSPEIGAFAERGRWVVTFTDITARRQVEEQLHHAQKLEAVGRLAGGVAHDFNNLLTSIGGFATLAREAVPPGDPVHDDLLEIERGAGRGRALTRQLLTFSRQDRIQPEVIDVRAVARDLERMLSRLVREDIDLRIVLGDAPAMVLADRGQVEQVITNLVVNAGDAMEEDGTIRISVSVAAVQETFAGARSDIPPGRYALLSVADTGTGIPPAVRERIFEPFYTTKEHGKGTGLGLSTVWGIVRQSGGHIHLYTEEGRGTVFKIYLPVIDSAEATPTSPASAPAEADAHGGATVLVVEDQEAVRRLATRVLQLRGFTVLEASDGDEALDVIDENPQIDLLITDIIMRGTGGLELLERLRERGRMIPTLFISGYSDAELPLGGAHFLEKPFSPDDLVRKAREVLGT